jgi:hypothetical protein
MHAHTGGEITFWNFVAFWSFKLRGFDEGSGQQEKLNLRLVRLSGQTRVQSLFDCTHTGFQRSRTSQKIVVLGWIRVSTRATEGVQLFSKFEFFLVKISPENQKFVELLKVQPQVEPRLNLKFLPLESRLTWTWYHGIVLSTQWKFWICETQSTRRTNFCPCWKEPLRSIFDTNRSLLHYFVF